MNKLPITYVIYLTTEGYHGVNTLYQATLEHTNRQLPLSFFKNRLASIKITPGREKVAEIMTEDLKRRGFEVITATAPWERGSSHFVEYIKDMIRVSQHKAVWSTPYVFVTDHDYPMICHKEPLLEVISKMVEVVESSPNVVSMRFARENELQPVISVDNDRNLYWSKDWNIQPMIMRSRDYFLACKIIEDNFSIVPKVHGEALWRDVLAPFSRSGEKHGVWLNSFAEVANLGGPDYAEVSSRLNITIPQVIL
jgi:hypothetical protein